MITHGKKWHYLAVKKLLALHREKTTNNKGDFYCLNYFHTYSREKKDKKYYKVCKNC